MNYRKNLSGKMAFYSFVPPLISDYKIEIDRGRLAKLTDKFAELDALLATAAPEDIDALIRTESNDSEKLSSDKPVQHFALPGVGDNENAENISRATIYGREALADLPLSTRLIKNIHYIICQSSDYDKKYRGEYRSSPLWIGSPGSRIDNAQFVAPAGDDMNTAIAELDNYINNSDDNVFVKSAVIHYRFEMIHPFIDGNGRTGRVLNLLYLAQCGALCQPALFQSHVIARDYNGYCEALQHTHRTNDISWWINYWSDLLLAAADSTINSIKFHYPI